MSRPLSGTTTVSLTFSAVPFARRYSDTPAHWVVGNAHRADQNVTGTME